MSSPRVRPRALLWTLLGCNVAATIFFLVLARNMAREASDMVLREPEMRAKTEKGKTRIQNITDIEELRSLALKSCDSRFEEWRDIGYRYRQMSDAVLWASLGTATISMVLAYSIYGLRIKNPVA
ncbi:MAG: hypothetical protein D4R57_00140 [Verrucomicrobiales bacterium]|nr:MAG: hypothetical protein D4R57_00140 [Verrucomicrobiales bacterium]